MCIRDSAVAVKVLGIVFLFGPGVSSGDGINKDEVGDSEDRIRVVDELVGRFWAHALAVGRHLDALGSEASEMEPNGR